MRLSLLTRCAGLQMVAAAFAGALCWPAQAALYQCTSATGDTLFTDGGCPSGYTTDLVVPEAPVPATPAPAPEAPVVPASNFPHPAQAPDAEAARLQAELENARLRSELEQERLRTIDRKLDALLEAQPAYGAVGVIPFGFVPKPFSMCGGKPGQTPWVNCRPRRNDLKPKAFRGEPGSCGVVGCTPGIMR